MERIIEFVLNHYIMSLALAVVTFLLIQDFFESAFKKYKSLSPMLAVAKMNQENVTIIDVREPNEYKKGYIENAINIPLAKLEEKIDTFADKKNSPVIVVCQTGTRSLPGCKTLTKNGFNDVYSMIGGMQSWEDSNLPIRINKD